MSVDQWYDGGKLVEVLPANGAESRALFARIEGNGPVVTLVHGYPTSSYDWAGISQILKAKYTVLSFDLLGFGHS